MSARALGVLVGVDGSEDGWRALDWAVQDAAAAGMALTVAHVVDLPRVAGVPVAPELADQAERDGRRLLDRAVERSASQAPEVGTACRLVSGHLAAELLRLAADADEVAVGARGAGGFASLLLGSVSTRIAAYAPCPVAIVRGDANPGGAVVVGVDGTPRGEVALEYGFGYAARHGLEVQAMHLYLAHLRMRPHRLPPAEPEAMRTEVGRLAREAADRRAASYPGVASTWTITEGSPAERLVLASGGARLVVIGSRRQAALAGVLLGSVGQAVLRHARCPVVVAR